MNALSSTSTISLSEIMATKLGSVDPSKFKEEVFDLYSIPAFDSGQPEVIEGNSIGSAKQIVQPGDVLLSKIVPHIRRAWIVGDNRGRRLIASGEWIVFRGNVFHAEYLRHAIVSDQFHVQFMATVSGVGGSLLRARPAQVANIKIPLPPLAEQKRIAAILDKADAVRRKRQQAIKLADDFLRATFLDMFGDIPAKKSKYDFKVIRPFCSARSGKSSNKVISTKKTDYPIYGGNGVNGWATKPLYYEPVIVLGRVGQQCGIVHHTNGPSWVTDNAIVISITNKDKLHPIYLAAALKNSLLRATVERLDLPFINQSIIMDYPLPLPPLVTQLEYVEIVEKFVVTLKKHNTLLKSSKTMFNSLTQRAFRGEL